MGFCWHCDSSAVSERGRKGPRRRPSGALDRQV